MRVGILGINHKLASLKLRDLLAKICARRLHPGKSTHGSHFFVPLSTCNRTEIYFSSANLPETHSYLLSILRNDVSDDFDQKLYSYFGPDCLLHLSRVTSGLDSAIIAETEIQGQVKSAYELAKKFYALPFELHYLFQKSLSIAKKVRRDLPSKPGLPDVGQAIYQTALHFFKHKKDPSILFVGASGINEQILIYLKAKKLTNIFLCNRSEDAAHKIAAKHKVNPVAWNHIESWHTYDWIILGTKAPGFIILDSAVQDAKAMQFFESESLLMGAGHSQKVKAAPIKSDYGSKNCVDLASSTAESRIIHPYNLPADCLQPKLIIDLSVPRNADPALARRPEITLLNIDQINRRLKVRRKNLFQSLHQAEELLQKMAFNQMKLFHDKESSREYHSSEQLISAG